MSEYFITFQSLTAAHQAVFALIKEGIPAQLIRTPKQLSAYGCSYAIRIPADAQQRAELLFLQNQFKWERIFSIAKDWTVQEIWF